MIEVVIAWAGPNGLMLPCELAAGGDAHPLVGRWVPDSAEVARGEPRLSWCAPMVMWPGRRTGRPDPDELRELGGALTHWFEI